MADGGEEMGMHMSSAANIRGTNSQHLHVSRLGLQLSLRNILKPSVKWRIKMNFP